MSCSLFSQNYKHVCWTMLGALHVMWSSPNLIKSSLVSLLNKSRQVSLFTLKAGMCIWEKLENTEKYREREREREREQSKQGVRVCKLWEKKKKMQYFLCSRHKGEKLGVFSRRGFRVLQPQRDEAFRMEILLLHWFHWIEIFWGEIVIILGNLFLYFPNLLNSIFGHKLEYSNLYLL